MAGAKEHIANFSHLVVHEEQLARLCGTLAKHYFSQNPDSQVLRPVTYVNQWRETSQRASAGPLKRQEEGPSSGGLWIITTSRSRLSNASYKLGSVPSNSRLARRAVLSKRTGATPWLSRRRTTDGRH
jgi:hypothetical protein